MSLVKSSEMILRENLVAIIPRKTRTRFCKNGAVVAFKEKQINADVSKITVEALGEISNKLDGKNFVKGETSPVLLENSIL
jgi:hypothetical protein